jgi:hypothetical protein
MKQSDIILPSFQEGNRKGDKEMKEIKNHLETLKDRKIDEEQLEAVAGGDDDEMILLKDFTKRPDYANAKQYSGGLAGAPKK